MKPAGQLILGLTFAAFIASAADAGDLAAAANPYTTISERNVFALVPIPIVSNDPVAPPKDPPPKITPNGIMSLFGKLEVLFKVALKPTAAQPAKEASYVMAEGERQDDIEVVKIDQTEAKITFRNHGELQELPLADAPKLTTPAVTGAVGGAAVGGTVGGVPPVPSSRIAAAAAARAGLQGRAGSGTPTASDAPAAAVPAGDRQIYNPAAEAKPAAADAGLAPEDKVLKGYLGAKLNNDPAAALFPISAKDKKDADNLLADPTPK